MATSTLSHQNLGAIRGIVRNGVVSYRGVKYASLKHRFAEPQKLAKLGDGVYDATKYGPASISSRSGCAMEQDLIQQRLPDGGCLSFSDTECLNLVLNIPEGSHHGLPVFAFIHGGGYMIGANSWPQADLAAIVRLSAQVGTPVIGVGINYRLGACGFLHSRSLAEAGIKPNRGLRDQRTALLWLKENIAGFGGDPNRVTAIGESAGAVSITHHLNSREPLFQQLVAMGGSSLLMKPLPGFVAEFVYGRITKDLGISDDPVSSQIEKLKNLPADEILARSDPSLPLMPVLDDDLIHTPASFSQWSEADLSSKLPGISWVKRAMLGDCQFDGSIFTFPLLGRKAGIAAAFTASARGSLKTHLGLAESLFKAYSITPGTPDGEALLCVLTFANDIGFQAPVLTLAQAWPDSAFNYNSQLPPEQQRSAEKFAKDIIAFVNGVDPYPKYSAAKGGAQVYGSPGQEASTFIQGTKQKDYGRSSTIFELSKDAGLDPLKDVWDRFLASQ